MKSKLKVRQVKECLMREPTISSIEEMCAVLNVDINRIPEEDYKAAAWLIERNRLRLQVSLKNELYRKTDQKAKELLYKMICSPDDLKRWGVRLEGSTTNNITPTIVLKSEDPDILDKVKQL